MFGIGSTEILVILVVALIVVGPKSIPQIAKTLGKYMGEIRKVSTEFQRAMNTEAAMDEYEQEQQKKKNAQAAPATASASSAPAHAGEAASGGHNTPSEATAPPTAQASTPADAAPTVESADPMSPAADSPLAQAIAKAEAEANADATDTPKA